METSDKVLVGAALGTLLGSLAVLIAPKNSRRQLFGKAKDAVGYLEEAYHRFPNLRRQNPHKFFWSGSALGALLGAGTALMLAPKSGKHLRSQLVKTYNEIADRTHDVLDMIQPHSNNQVVQRASNALTKTKKKVRSNTIPRKQRPI